MIVHQLQRKENAKKILLKVCRDLFKDNEVARLGYGSLGGECKKILWDSFGKSKRRPRLKNVWKNLDEIGLNIRDL